MAKGIGPILLLGGAAALAALSMKKKSGSGSINIDPNKVPDVGTDKVGFSLNFEEYKIGSNWKIKVLDQYLNDARKAGDLAVENWKTMHKGDASFPWLEEMTATHGWDWDKGEDTSLAANVTFDKLLLQTKIDVLEKFFNSHYAAVPGSAVTLSKLPKTAATDEFFEKVMAYATQFQKRDFAGI